MTPSHSTCTQLCLCIRKSSRLKSNDECKCWIMTHRRVLCNMINRCGMERELLSIPCSSNACLNRIYQQSLVKIKQVFWWAHAHVSNYSPVKSSLWPHLFLTDDRFHAKRRIILWGRSWKVYYSVDHLLNAVWVGQDDSAQIWVILMGRHSMPHVTLKSCSWKRL